MLLAQHLANVEASKRPRVYADYPKWVRYDGKEQIVADREEELALLASWGAPVVDADTSDEPAPQASPEPVQNRLSGVLAASDEGTTAEPTKRGPGRPRKSD